LLNIAIKVIDDLLPEPIRVSRITTERITFVIPGGAEVPVLDLSDGYRAFLALAIDILRHLETSTDNFTNLFEEENGDVRVIAEGVILVDEIDAHLHPIWQREIAVLLRRSFPKMQFIVTSHSPFVAQAATDEGLILLGDWEENGVVRAEYLGESVRGWRVDQILTSQLFGLSGTRDKETEDLIRDHADLVAKRRWNKLTGCELRLMSWVDDVSDIPTAGKRLIVVAKMDRVFHFRIFDGDGRVVVDTDVRRLAEQSQSVDNLSEKLERLWPPNDITESEKIWVIAAITSIIGRTYLNEGEEKELVRLESRLAERLTFPGETAEERHRQ
jgi:AAA domain, putative AbiEii toxin, Type IV TA system